MDIDCHLCLWSISLLSSSNQNNSCDAALVMLEFCVSLQLYVLSIWLFPLMPSSTCANNVFLRVISLLV